MTTSSTIEFPGNAESAALLADLWRDADVHPAWPADTRTVCELLRAGGGFDVTVEVLDAWARSKQVGPVAVRGTGFAWAPQNVHLAAALCNASRRWIALHPKHIHRMTAIELAEAQASAVGQSVFTDAETVDCRSLIGVIQATDDVELRAVLCVALLTKLKQAGIQ